MSLPSGSCGSIWCMVRGSTDAVAFVAEWLVNVQLQQLPVGGSQANSESIPGLLAQGRTAMKRDSIGVNLKVLLPSRSPLSFPLCSGQGVVRAGVAHGPERSWRLVGASGRCPVTGAVRPGGLQAVRGQCYCRAAAAQGSEGSAAGLTPEPSAPVMVLYRLHGIRGLPCGATSLPSWFLRVDLLPFQWFHGCPRR
jgi:hypothetical protein